MPDVSLLGLGLMGSALAKSIQSAGLELGVWNRSAEKMRLFQDAGAVGFPDAASAVSASPVILICVDTYATTRNILADADTLSALRGRTVVQLSSARPREVEHAAEWMNGLGVAYLDGAILAGPEIIGTERAQVLLSGEKSAYEAAAPILRSLGNIRYLGENAKAAESLGMAWLMSRFGNQMAAIHAASICISEGAELKDLISLLGDNSSLQYYLGVIEGGNFDEFSASLEIWHESLQHIRQQGADAGINTEVPDFIESLFERAVNAGYAKQNVMALTKILR